MRAFIKRVQHPFGNRNHLHENASTLQACQPDIVKE